MGESTDSGSGAAPDDEVMDLRTRGEGQLPLGVAAHELAAAPPQVLVCRDLLKRFGALQAVRGVSFQIAEGETYGLLGPNGAGKTTTISMVCGLLEPDGGQVIVAGRPLTTRSVAEKAAIGYVPQELAIYPDLSARENLMFFARLYGLATAQASARVDEVLEVIGLTDRAADRTKEFSGGMQRRLNIGIGLLHRPRLLILDEPTVGVDPQSRNAILESVEQLAGEGMAVLYTTHYMEEAERLCDRIGIVDLGELRAEGTRAELVALVGEHDRIVLEGVGDLRAAARAAGALPDVRAASAEDGGLHLIADNARSVLPELLRVATRAGVTVSSVDVDRPDLEAVFLHLTGRALRD
jgi:ABC-2 type transport system ATP-binding protein